MMQKKAVCFGLWFSSHNNPRYADLFPRLDPFVRFYKVALSRHRVLRGVEYRLWQALRRRVIYPGTLRYFARRYETLFTVDCRQIPAWPRHESVVVDADDPVFSPTEVMLLNLPQVKAVIVTTEKAKTKFEELGVTRPIYVVPQGVSMERADPCKRQEIRTQFKRDGDVVVGYHAPTLTLSCDGPGRAREGLDDLDFLFDAIAKAREVEPQITLWLLGEPSQSVKRYATGKPWVKLLGYVPFSDILNYVSNFDIAAYPRTCLDPIRFRVKICEYMGCGIPIISTNVEESFIVKEANCGIICKSREDFSKALVELVQSAEKRVELASAGRTYARTKLDWSVLMPTYKEILMR